MEKRTPHYRLSEIQAQMHTVQGLRLNVKFQRDTAGFYFTISFKPLREAP